MKKLNINLARKVLEVVDKGLVRGLGKPIPGQFCVEAAVQYVLTDGKEHNAEPKCVGGAVRAFKIRLNDCIWSSDKARAKGMRQLAIAQLGSNEINQMEFGKLMFLRGTQKILPFVFRVIAKIKPKGEVKDNLNKHADICEAVITFEQAKSACSKASAYASTSTSASASASAYADAYAYAYADAYAYASTSASAYASAYASADFEQAKLGKKDRLLLLTAEVGVECLKELKSPGCKWLHICD